MSSWPSRFIYVCSATRAGIVNMLPLQLAGMDRLAAVFILCGAEKEDTSNSRDFSDAVEPALRIARLIRAKRPDLKPEPLYGDPNDYTTWANYLLSAAKAAHPDCPVIFNLRGGTKPMALGGLAGILSLPAGHGLLVDVGSELQPRFIDPARSMLSSVIDADRFITITEFLEAQGYDEFAAGSRPAREGWNRKHRDRIARLAEALLPDIESLAPIIAESVKHLFDERGNKFTPGLIAPMAVNKGSPETRLHVATCMADLAGLMGLTANATDQNEPALFASNGDGARFIKSGWLEAYLFNRIEAVVGLEAGVKVAANVGLRFAEDGRSDHESSFGELDVAVMIRNQLHGFEVKLTSLKARHSQDKPLDQGRKFKLGPGGPQGQYTIVAPRTTEAALIGHPGAFLDQAERLGIALALGPNAVDTAVAQVEAWVSSE